MKNIGTPQRVEVEGTDTITAYLSKESTISSNTFQQRNSINCRSPGRNAAYPPVQYTFLGLTGRKLCFFGFRHKPFNFFWGPKSRKWLFHIFELFLIFIDKKAQKKWKSHFRLFDFSLIQKKVEIKVTRTVWMRLANRYQNDKWLFTSLIITARPPLWVDYKFTRLLLIIIINLPSSFDSKHFHPFFIVCWQDIALTYQYFTDCHICHIYLLLISDYLELTLAQSITFWIIEHVQFIYGSYHFAM